MSAQVLVNVVPVTALAAGASITLPHGLVSGGTDVPPVYVAPDRATPIVVVSFTDTDITFRNDGTGAETANFRCERGLSQEINYATATPVVWKGNPGGGGGGGAVNSVSGTAGRISSTGGANPVIDLVNTAVTPGAYTNANITVDAAGRITLAANGTPGGVASLTVDAGELTNTGTATNPVIGLANAGTAGTYAYPSSMTTDAFGRVTAVTAGSAPVTSVSVDSGELTNTGTATAPVLGLATTAVTPGAYTLASVTVDSFGRVTLASSGTAVTSVSVDSGELTNTGTATAPVLGLATTAVTPGAYTYASLTVDSFGRLTVASSGAAPVTSVTVDAGELTNTGTSTAPVLGLANAGTAGTYAYPSSMTTDAFGRVTAVTAGSAPVASGWTDDGSTVRLTTANDVVSVGANTGASGRKLTVTNTGTDFGYRGIGAASADNILDLIVSGDTNARLAISANGNLTWGTGAAVADARLYRSGTKELTVDDGAAGSAIFGVKGLLSSQARKLQTVSTAAANYNVAATDDVVFVAPAGATSVNLPVAALTVVGRRITIKRTNNTANVVTVSAPPGSTVEGTLSIALAGGGYDAVTLIAETANAWWVV